MQQMQQVLNQLLQLMQQGVDAIFRFVHLIWSWSVDQIMGLTRAPWEDWPLWKQVFLLLVIAGLAIHVLIGVAQIPSPVRVALFLGLSGALLFAASAVDKVSEAAARRLQRAREREALLRSIVATMPDAMIVSDEEGRILSVNPAATRMFGWFEHELMGRNLGVLMRERVVLSEMLSEADVEAHVAAVRALLRRLLGAIVDARRLPSADDLGRILLH